MAFTIKQMSLTVATLGVLSFIFGVIAENKKPAAGTPITGKGVVICKYPSDPSVVLGYLSTAFLVVCTFAGWYSLFYPYQGKSIPQAALFQNKSFLVFFNVAVVTTGLAATLLLWSTIQEQLHHVRNIHPDLETKCPIAKTGILGGEAFVSLDSCLFWLVALMLLTMFVPITLKSRTKKLQPSMVLMSLLRPVLGYLKMDSLLDKIHFESLTDRSKVDLFLNHPWCLFRSLSMEYHDIILSPREASSKGPLSP
ncbi:hypothetical protein DH2020_044046 [Rehmannia glutinosa]|uniref:Uncharacterized protein n=1 Tax=Rehmannia glutinosa TaxID=99300 RepID=A0ABR0UI05_REHGL